MATRLLGKIEAAFFHLTKFPNSGAARESLAPMLRVAFSGKYVVYYRVVETEVIVVRVLHGARDISAIVDNEGFAF